MSIHVRLANIEEVEILKTFEQGIVEAERPYGDTLKAEGVSYYDLAELIQSDDAHVIVAANGDEIVGTGYAKIVASKEYYTHAQHAHLGFMFVLPEYRGLGINKMIIDELLDWSRKMGITEARLEVYLENKSAVKAYEKVGFRPNLLEMRMGI